MNSELYDNGNLDLKHYKQCRKTFEECLRCSVIDVFMTRLRGQSIKYSASCLNYY